MTTPQENLIAAYFHANRSAAKKKPDPIGDKIMAAMLKRLEMEGKLPGQASEGDPEAKP